MYRKETGWTGGSPTLLTVYSDSRWPDTRYLPTNKREMQFNPLFSYFLLLYLILQQSLHWFELRRLAKNIEEHTINWIYIRNGTPFNSSITATGHWWWTRVVFARSVMRGWNYMYLVVVSHHHDGHHPSQLGHELGQCNCHFTRRVANLELVTQSGGM